MSASVATIVTGTPVPAAVDNSTSAGGRIVIFVVDRESIQSGTEKALFDSAGSVIDALGPADAAGAAAIPAGTVQFTRDRAVVRDTLQKFTGTMPSTGWRWTISWDEAIGIERGDKQVLAQVLYRECRAPRRPRDPGEMPLVPEGCDKTVVSQSNEMLLQGRLQARSVLAALKNIATGLTALRGPKHLVLISGGLLFDTTLLSEYTETARAAAAVGITLDAIHVDQPATDTTSMRRPVTSAFGGRELSSGLTTLAGMTGGSFFYGVGRATGVFDRIRTEIANFYELGLETVPADADGKPHEIVVKVNRPNATVRARREVVMAARAAKPADCRRCSEHAAATADRRRRPAHLARELHHAGRRGVAAEAPDVRPHRRAAGARAGHLGFHRRVGRQRHRECPPERDDRASLDRHDVGETRAGRLPRADSSPSMATGARACWTCR